MRGTDGPFVVQYTQRMTASEMQTPTRFNPGVSACPDCGHRDVGTQSWGMSILRRILRRRPNLTCPADDGLGGGFEHDGSCDCGHQFHS